MNKQISWPFALLIVAIAVGVCAFIYSRTPIVPTAPPQPKGSNRPPAGIFQHKLGMNPPKTPPAKKKPEAAADAAAPKKTE